MIDLFQITKSKTRQKIFSKFLENPGQDFYLRQLERGIHISVGNLRRELIKLEKSGLFQSYKKGKNIFYHLDQSSPYYKLIDQFSPRRDLLKLAFDWTRGGKPTRIPPDYYCPTRDVFQARLETQLATWERQIGQDAYLLTAAVGEIGNNSYDHNLGNWPSVPGAFFADDLDKRIVVVADRGRGILTTIRFIKPKVSNHRQALDVAFNEIISGRRDEHRGNGLKFVRNIIWDKNWELQFYSGDAFVVIHSGFAKKKIFEIKSFKKQMHGCLAVIKY